MCFAPLLTGSCLAACSCVSPAVSITVYTNSLPIIAGMVLYNSPTLSSGTRVVNGYYSNGTTCYLVTGGNGVVQPSPSACPTPTTTSTTTTSTTTQPGFIIALCYSTFPPETSGICSCTVD